LPGQALGQSRIGVRGVASNTGAEPRLQVFPAINDPPPEFALEGAIPAQAQLCQRAR